MINMIPQKVYQDTVNMLDACNALALINNLPAVIQHVFDEDKGLNYVAHHPITLLWISKIASLCYGEDAPYKEWNMAYNYCRLMAGQKVEGPMWSEEKEYD